MLNQNYEQIVVVGKSLLDTVQCNQLISKHDTAQLENVIQTTYRNVLVKDMDIFMLQFSVSRLVVVILLGTVAAPGPARPGFGVFMRRGA